MAFANGFDGDTVSLNYILQTLVAKTVAIEGVTCNPNLSVSVDGMTAYYYTRGTTTVNTGTIGAKHTYVSTGNTQVSFSITSCVNIDAVIPHVNITTVSADVVADRVIFETISASNTYNQAFLTALYATTATDVTATTALTASTVYGDVIDGIKEFNVANKAKGLKPTGIIVGPTVAALLLKAPEFIRSTIVGDTTVLEGKIGSIAGLPVVYHPDLDETTNKIDYILINAEGFAAPQNVSTLYVVDATTAGYPGGVLITGEIGYGFKIADNDLIKLRKHA